MSDPDNKITIRLPNQAVIDLPMSVDVGKIKEIMDCFGVAPSAVQYDPQLGDASVVSPRPSAPGGSKVEVLLRDDAIKTLSLFLSKFQVNFRQIDDVLAAALFVQTKVDGKSEGFKTIDLKFHLKNAGKTPANATSCLRKLSGWKYLRKEGRDWAVNPQGVGHLNALLAGKPASNPRVPNKKRKARKKPAEKSKA